MRETRSPISVRLSGLRVLESFADMISARCQRRNDEANYMIWSAESTRLFAVRFAAEHGER